jgi:dihydropteroate synthase
VRRPLPAAPAVVGIVNVTPDSFSDGGAFLSPLRAAEHAERLVAEGADMLDIGAESTRPGAAAVAPAEELERLMPALEAIRARVVVPLCVDTRHAMTARAALDAGACAINDVSMLRHDRALAFEVARAGATLIVMHSRGTPADMQAAPRYVDVALEVREELENALGAALDAGCRLDRIVVDPGFGFAKTHAHNLELLQRLGELRALGAPILVGLSRKALVGQLLADAGGARPVDGRDAGSVGLALAAWLNGADYLRVHDVAATADALRTFRAALPASLKRPETTASMGNASPAASRAPTAGA